jgi:tetratricopeptide (TPR) repeat protein
MGQPAVFLSYASQDSDAAARICTSLRSRGIEVWFDQSALRGGDAWDATIRGQIKTCTLFIPVISAATRVRGEGYFRLEWKLAIDRSYLMASDEPFLLPVVIDDTSESDARVPELFLDVHWTRLPGGEIAAGFAENVAELLAKRRIHPTEAIPSTPKVSREPGRTAGPNAEGERAGTPLSARRGFWATIVLIVLGAGLFAARQFSTPIVIAPYSAQDRRMTFAMIPLGALAGNSAAEEVAKATTDIFQSRLELNKLWVHAATPAQVLEAVSHTIRPADLARQLDVHFLVRGTVARSEPGYIIHLYTVDGITERELGSQDVTVPKDALVPRWLDDVDVAIGLLVYYGLQAEVKRRSDVPAAKLDVRDLTFRAFDQWMSQAGENAKRGYDSATELLKRALALDPNDLLALKVTATINLCDCINAWSKNPQEQRAIGADAVDRFLIREPTNTSILFQKGVLFQITGRWEESLQLANAILRQNPDNYQGLDLKATSLMKLGKAGEALPIADGLLDRLQDRSTDYVILAASAHFAVGDYENAARLAQAATSRMTEEELRNPTTGPVQLALAAAEAYLGRKDRARTAIADFNRSLPDVNSITAIRKWMSPAADLAGFEPLFAGLKQMEVPE